MISVLEGLCLPVFLCILCDEGKFVNRTVGVGERGCPGLWFLVYDLFCLLCDVGGGGDVDGGVLGVAECCDGY